MGLGTGGFPFAQGPTGMWVLGGVGVRQTWPMVRGVALSWGGWVVRAGAYRAGVRGSLAGGAGS